MHVFAIVVVWFYLMIAGIILTMLMPRVASESRSYEVVPRHVRAHVLTSHGAEASGFDGSNGKRSMIHITWV